MLLELLMQDERREGREEGRKEGRKAGELEGAREMLQMALNRFGELPENLLKTLHQQQDIAPGISQFHPFLRDITFHPQAAVRMLSPGEGFSEAPSYSFLLLYFPLLYFPLGIIPGIYRGFSRIYYHFSGIYLP